MEDETLSTMSTRGSEVAEMAIKLKITLRKDSTIGNQMPRDIVVPKFDHKVSSVVQTKSEVSGTLGGNYELVWDGTQWVMREVVDPQQTIFDVYPHDEQADYSEHEHGGQPALTRVEILGLSDKGGLAEVDTYTYDNPSDDEVSHEQDEY